jgi:hypothetical protein
MVEQLNENTGVKTMSDVTKVGNYPKLDLAIAAAIDDCGDPLAQENLPYLYEAIADAGFVIEQGWQPIETAPKDGTPVLCFEPHSMGGYCFVAAPNEDGDWCDNLATLNTYKPTHWMPLPAPPTIAALKAKEADNG